KKAIREVFAARDKAMSDFPAKNAEKVKAASAALTEAFKSKDQEAIAKAQKAYQELYAPMYEAMRKSNDELLNILTPEQRAKQQEHQFTAAVKAMTAGVQLSDEQMKKLRAAWGDVVKNRETASGDWYKAFQQVLTPEQETAIAKQRAMSYVKAAFLQANLTKDQLKQLEDLAEKFAKDRDRKPWDWEANQKLAEQVNGLLTPEQKEAMKKSRAFFGQPGGAGVFGPAAPAGGGAKAPCPKSEAAPAKCPAPEKKSVGANVWQVGPGQFKLEITEAKPGESPRKRPAIVLSEGKEAGTQGYWLGLYVEPREQGLVIEHVMPDSPAAKGGLKPHDVLVKAGDKPLKNPADLIEAVQKAKETNVALEVLRDGKTQKITVKPAARPAEAVVYNLGDLLQRAEPGKPAQPGVKVTQLPGGGIQVIIEEEAEGKEGAAGQESQKASSRQQEALQAAEKAAKTRMRDTVKRQHELADEASNIQELRNQVQELRRQVEQLKAMVEKSSRPEKK
ncbi:MAG: PDZ domain-containing protein, partial [Thermoguttaceae bacterium]